LAEALGRSALVVRTGALPLPGPELARLARLIEREALLVDGLTVIEAGNTHDSVLAAFLGDLETPLVVVVGDCSVDVPGRLALHRSIALPTGREARSLWKRALGEPVARTLVQPIEEIAQHFRLSAAAVEAVARELGATAASEADRAHVLRRLCRERARASLEGLAQRIDPEATWDDLVLPETHVDLLREIVRHVRYRTQVYERW